MKLKKRHYVVGILGAPFMLVGAVVGFVFTWAMIGGRLTYDTIKETMLELNEQS